MVRILTAAALLATLACVAADGGAAAAEAKQPSGKADPASRVAELEGELQSLRAAVRESKAAAQQFNALRDSKFKLERRMVEVSRERDMLRSRVAALEQQRQVPKHEPNRGFPKPPAQAKPGPERELLAKCEDDVAEAWDRIAALEQGDGGSAAGEPGIAEALGLFAGAVRRDCGRLYTALAERTAPLVASAKAQAESLTSAASQHAGQVWGAVTAAYTQHLAPTLAPHLAKAQTALEPHTARVRAAVGPQVGHAWTVASEKAGEAVERGQALRAHLRQQALDLFRREETVAAHAECIVDWTEYAIAAAAVLVSALPLLRLAFAVLSVLLGLLLRIATLNYCCGLCACGKGGAGASGNNKRRKKRGGAKGKK